MTNFNMSLQVTEQVQKDTFYTTVFERRQTDICISKTVFEVGCTCNKELKLELHGCNQ